MTEPDITPRDALEIARNALQEVHQLSDRVHELEQQVERLESKCVDLDSEYAEMSKAEKVATIRHKLIQRAQESNGKAKLDYNDVRLLFDDKPAASYTYDLMETAAEERGYEYQAPASDNNRIVVDMAHRKAALSVSPAKKEPQGEHTSAGDNP
jgi:phage shock protein A